VTGVADVDVWRLVLIAGALVVLAGLVLWRVLGPLCPSRRASAWFAGGVLLTVPTLAAAVVLFLAQT